MAEKLSWWVEINIPTSKKQEEFKKPETSKLNPKVEAFGICSKLFNNDSFNPIQDIEECFSIASQTPEAIDFFTIITALPEEELKGYFDAKKWIPFKDVCTNDAISEFCGSFKEYKVIQTDTKVQAVDEQVQAVDKEIKNLTVEQWNTLSDLREKLATHTELNQKDVKTILDGTPPSSPEFQQAAKNILAELKAQAQKSGDFQEYAKFVTDFHEIGAMSDVEYAVLQREMDTLAKDLKKTNSEIATKSYRLPEGFHEVQNTEGVYIRYAPVGEKFDQIVTIKDGKSFKDIVSPRSGYSIRLGDVTDMEQTFVQDEAKIRGDINEITETYNDILTKNDDFIAKEEKREGKTEKEIETLEKAKTFKKEKTQEFQINKRELEAKLMKLQGEQAQKKSAEGNKESREEKVRNAINVVDDMGLYMLGVENVDKFFDILNMGSSNGKIDISNGLDKAEKAKIKQAFIELLGQDVFEPNPSCRLRQGRTNQDIKKLLIEKKIYKEGEVPPVKLTDLKTAMTKNNA